MRVWIVAAYFAARALKVKMVFTTTTFSHRSEDELKRLIADGSLFRQRMRGRRDFKDWEARNGVWGSVRAREETWGDENGWHVHFHEIIFFKPTGSVKVAEVGWGYTRLWSKAVRDHGGMALDGRPYQDSRAVTNLGALSEYIAKTEQQDFSWEIQDEMTRQTSKTKRKGRYMYNGLLKIGAGMISDPKVSRAKATALVDEFMFATKGRSRFHKTAGLSDRLGLDEYMDEAQEYLEAQLADTVKAVEYPEVRQYWEIFSMDARDYNLTQMIDELNTELRTLDKHLKETFLRLGEFDLEPAPLSHDTGKPRTLSMSEQEARDNRERAPLVADVAEFQLGMSELVELIKSQEYRDSIADDPRDELGGTTPRAYGLIAEYEGPTGKGPPEPEDPF